MDGVYAANDGQAGGVIAALTGAPGLSELPPVTGQDAEIAAIQRIVAGQQYMVAGQQYMTVYKPIKVEADKAALALCDNLDVVANLFLGQEYAHLNWLDEIEMEKQSWRLLRQLSAKIPSVRIPVASLSGGQRQTVAIARSLVGSPGVVLLDGPTAALGVAQTAEVLNLIELLRDQGLGVILVSHNMADVQAVADRIVVLRLGRNPPSSVTVR